jgi:hypothetical protein
MEVTLFEVAKEIEYNFTPTRFYLKIQKLCLEDFIKLTTIFPEMDMNNIIVNLKIQNRSSEEIEKIKTIFSLMNLNNLLMLKIILKVMKVDILFQKINIFQFIYQTRDILNIQI